MKKKILSSIFIMVIMIGMLFILTGCGSNQSNNIISELNSIVDQAIESYKEKGHGTTLTVAYIQNSLDKKNSAYVIVASGDKEFTSAPAITEYKETGIENYDGNSYDNTRMLETDMTVNYFVVYDKTNNKYYNVKVSYKNAGTDGVTKEYPEFSDAIELK